MDQTPFSRPQSATAALILKRFPGSEGAEIARLGIASPRLIAYLAETNDLTRTEADEILAMLPLPGATGATENALKAA